MNQTESNFLLEEDPPCYPFVRAAPMEAAREACAALQSGCAQQVTLFNGRKIWLVTKYRDVRQVLASKSVSNYVNHPSLPKLSPLDGKGNDENPSFLHLDDPKHRALRRPLSKFFTREKALEMRPELDALVKNLVSEMRFRTQPVDFIAQFARKLPLVATCRLLGLPDTEGSFFTRSTMDSVSTDSDHNSKTSAVYGLRSRIRSAMEARRHALCNGSPAKDTVIDHLLQTNGLPKDFEDLLSSVQVLLVGGLETTTNALGFALLHGSENRDAWVALSASADACEAYVEEALRLYTIFDIGLTRAVDEHITLSCGTVMQPGDGVVVSLTAANRDPEVFASPDRFVMDRDRCPHLAFGYGPHFCIGHFLARETMKSALSILAEAFPDLRVEGKVAELPFSDGQAIFGPLRLPVSWGHR